MVIIFMEVKYPRVTYRCQDIFVYLYSERMAQSQKRFLCDVFESHTLGRFPARLGLERTTGGRGAYLQIGSHLSTHPGPHSQCGPNGKKIPASCIAGERWDGGGGNHLHMPLWALGTVKISSNRE